MFREEELRTEKALSDFLQDWERGNVRRRGDLRYCEEKSVHIKLRQAVQRMIKQKPIQKQSYIRLFASIKPVTPLIYLYLSKPIKILLNSK